MRRQNESPAKPQGFGGRYRLRHSKDFDCVFRSRKARLVRNRFVSIRSCPNSRGYARLGLIVSRKTARRAVSRNRLKRFVRESFRHCRAQLPAADFVVICHAVMSDMSRQRLNGCLRESWRAVMRKRQPKASKSRLCCLLAV